MSMFPLDASRSSAGNNQHARASPSALSSAARQGPGVSGGAGGPLAMNHMDAKSSVSGKRVDIKGLLPSNALEKTLYSVAYNVTTDTEMSTPVTWALAVCVAPSMSVFPTKQGSTLILDTLRTTSL
ncbi:hypothetical protein BCR44DRAFT_1077726 [Catenaria anguillulae PL171]|uniref:Uncharacterized protein n=1 Tax=Catenaria anguillulae PL171 TaxID=765915 RepID=A0A1Y2HRN6_9FUNG|nr:hypothetical protein BCR44DRAFT_1077726 [Catenaria anguillulae PL171]